MVTELGASAAQVAVVVFSTIGIYLSFIVLVRMVGQRSLASMSSFDFGCVIALGAVMGRTVLLETPTLLTGIVGLGTLFAMQGVLGVLRTQQRLDRLMNRSPVLLMSGDRLLRDNMRKAHVVEDEIRQNLRLAGIRRLEEVQSVVLERNGAVSVIRCGMPVEPWLFADVPGDESRSAVRGR